MAFIPTMTTYSGHGGLTPKLRLHSAVSGKNGDRRRITFVLSLALVKDLQWQANDNIVIAVGTGSDRGAFQFTKSIGSRAGQKLVRMRQAASMRLHLSLPRDIHGMNQAEMLDSYELPSELTFSVADGILIATIPREAKKAISHDRPHLTAVS